MVYVDRLLWIRGLVSELEDNFQDTHLLQRKHRDGLDGVHRFDSVASSARKCLCVLLVEFGKHAQSHDTSTDEHSDEKSVM